MNPSSDFHRPCRAFHLGLVEYEEALRLQNNLVRARGLGEIGDVLLLLQHPPVMTMGKSGKDHNLIVPPALLQEKKIKVIYTDRGGDVTYHGPGQLVAYPILNIHDLGLSVPGFVTNLEEVAIRLLARYGIAAARAAKLRGVWVGPEKICSLGVHLSRWVSKHGLALNVSTDLDPFRWINPCGLTGCRITSIAKVLGEVKPMEEIETAIINEFAGVFGFAIAAEPPENLEGYR
jgi:lipoate-protein ligase B